MSVLKVIYFVLTLVLTCAQTQENHLDRKESWKVCLQTKNISCIVQMSKYQYQHQSNTSTNTSAINLDEIPQARETLGKPEILCHDTDILALQWKDKISNTVHFLEYSNNREQHHTELIYGGHTILRGLFPNTEYTIRLTSIQITLGYNIILNRSPEITHRTTRRSWRPRPPDFLFLNSLNLVYNLYTAVISWRQPYDRSCYFEIVYFGTKDLGDIRTIEVNTTKSIKQVMIDNLHFGQNYSLSIRAINNPRIRLESSVSWLNFSVPTCLETFKNLTYCVPEAPKNLKAKEIARAINHPHLPLYDIRVSWREPKYKPNIYTISLFDLPNGASKQMNISGKETSCEFTRVELGSSYQIYLVARSVKGPSRPAILNRYVNGTMALLESKSSMSIETILLIVSPFVIICLVLILVLNTFFVKKIKRNYFKKTQEKSLPEVSYITNLSKTSMQLIDEWELLSENLLIGDVLGQGAFGVVRKGYYVVGDGTLDVAIKMLKDDPTQEDLKQFYQEIDIMKSVPPHPHLVSLIGCITQGQGPLLVVEYCAKGDLHTYLKNILNRLTDTFEQNKPNFSSSLESMKYAANKLYDLNVTQKVEDDLIEPKHLISFARQIAMGMEYLSSLKLIHRDLATRNILITEANTVKISDFGLSRDVYHDNIYYKITDGKLPLRWMALESLTHQIYTIHSDVWSFGILLWEIVTLGSLPYPGVSTADLLPRLKSGYRMEKPTNCSDELYTIMSKCWKATPKERPTFCELRKMLDKILESVSNYLDLNMIQSTDISFCRDSPISISILRKSKEANNFSEGYVAQRTDVY